MIRHKIQLLILPLILLLASCSEPSQKKNAVKGDFAVSDFDPMTNWHHDSAVKDENITLRTINLDYTGALDNGFIIPTVRQTKEGKFSFEFKIKNTGKNPAKYHYKIYYQAETYKFPEADPRDSTRQNLYAEENFYGSWEDVSMTFLETPAIPSDGNFHTITGDFRIVGNPRDEKKYYSDKNDRWKRNPRVGRYSFLLVVTTPANLAAIPPYIQNISLRQENAFVNPYHYFLFGSGKNMNATVVMKSPVELAVAARPDPGSGIYISNGFFPEKGDGKYFCPTCGTDAGLAKNAPFEQFAHYVDASTKFANIPVIADIMQDNYSLTDYNWNRQFYRKEELVNTMATVSKEPCKTVISDPREHKIRIINPGTEFGKWEKQNVGIITRHGFTYGKWTVKAKLTELLNRNSLWNGLTNAIWLITQSQDPWNFRRACNKEGYMATYWGGQQDKRVPEVGYSEIDFEILKTVPYCPSYVLPPAYNTGIADQTNMNNWNVPMPEEIAERPGEIQVACTNWDMACWEPADFAEGCRAVTFDGMTFWTHRWDKNYRALTQKTPEQDDELFASEYYYFQIDWQPTRIIWRIGPSKDKLRVVGYQDQTITSIPNNQMLLIVTQEYHNTKWWVGSPLQQDNIPFPENDIPGEIYEVTIE